MDHVFLAWTIENWITVLLMAALGYLVFTIVVQLIRQSGFSGGQNASGQ